MKLENLETKGERVKNLRKKNNFSQTELAEKIGVSLNTLLSVEKNRCDLPTESTLILSKMFNVSMEYIASGKQETETEINEDEREVLTAMREDVAFKQVAIEAAKLKKKVINCFRNYKPTLSTSKLHA
jgi:transcriptional regulator with XRE-family HTH domain